MRKEKYKTKNKLYPAAAIVNIFKNLLEMNVITFISGNNKDAIGARISSDRYLGNKSRIIGILRESD